MSSSINQMDVNEIELARVHGPLKPLFNDEVGKWVCESADGVPGRLGEHELLTPTYLGPSSSGFATQPELFCHCSMDDVPLSIPVFFVQSIIPRHLPLGLHPVKTHLVHAEVAEANVSFTDELQSGITFNF